MLWTRTIFICTLTFIVSGMVFANDLSKEELAKRKLVSRLYQATDGALIWCPEEDSASFKKTLSQFKSAYPELVMLVQKSEYYGKAVDRYSDDLKKSDKRTKESLSLDCKYIQTLLDSMINTENGRRSVIDMLNTLKK